MCELREFIERINKNVDETWNSYSVYKAKRKMKDALMLIPRWYPGRTPPTSLTEILEDYRKMGTVDIQINYGYMYYFDELRKFKSYPYRLWRFYDNYEDKESLFKEPYIKYSTNETENTEMFFKEVFYNFVHEKRLTPEDISILKNREDVTEKLVDAYKNVVSKRYTNYCRNQLIDALQSVIDMLNKLGVMVDMKEANDKIAQKLRLDLFKLPDDTPLVEKGKIVGIEFEECSIFQLEALLCHYFNRLEKVREGIGKGLFFLAYFCDTENLFKINVDEIEGQELLECQKEYVVMNNIKNKMFKQLHDLFEKSQRDNTPEPEFLEIYTQTVEKHFRVYNEIFNLAPTGDEGIDEARRRFEIEFNTINITNSYFKHFNYITKTSLVEDLIIQAERCSSRINWGIIEDDNWGYRLKWNMLLGFDIPGLNMPLRLHITLKDLQKVACDYLKLSEIPLYVGAEDFDISDKKSGTQFLLPLTKEKQKQIKYLIENSTESTKPTKEALTDDALRRIKHINCMQLPNSALRMIAEKTNRTQICPDYMNMYNGRIRRTPRREV